MTTGNFADEPAPAPPSDPAPRSFRLPADYYASPATDIRPIFGKRVPFGCGIAAIVFLIGLSVFAAVISRSGFGKLIALLIAPSATAIPQLYASDVTPQERKALEDAMAAFRGKVRANQIPLPKVQPVLQEIQGAIGDHKIDRAEVHELTDQLLAAK